MKNSLLFILLFALVGCNDSGGENTGYSKESLQKAEEIIAVIEHATDMIDMRIQAGKTDEEIIAMLQPCTIITTDTMQALGGSNCPMTYTNNYLSADNTWSQSLEVLNENLANLLMLTHFDTHGTFSGSGSDSNFQFTLDQTSTVATLKYGTTNIALHIGIAVQGDIMDSDLLGTFVFSAVEQIKLQRVAKEQIISDTESIVLFESCKINDQPVSCDQLGTLKSDSAKRVHQILSLSKK